MLSSSSHDVILRREAEERVSVGNFLFPAGRRTEILFSRGSGRLLKAWTTRKERRYRNRRKKDHGPSWCSRGHCWCCWWWIARHPRWSAAWLTAAQEVELNHRLHGFGSDCALLGALSPCATAVRAWTVSSAVSLELNFQDSVFLLDYYQEH